VSATCPEPIAAERLLDYLLGELVAADEDALEAHLFSCARCAREAERLAGVATAVSRVIPPVLSRSRFEALASAGLVAQESALSPGDVTRVVYPPAGKLLVLHMRGADLADARRVDVELRTPAGEALARLDDVPFDAARGELLVACQRHFAETFPQDVVFALERVSGEERRPLAEYTVLHRPA
jgi:anti-sigma factor RsiW